MISAHTIDARVAALRGSLPDRKTATAATLRLMRRYGPVVFNIGVMVVLFSTTAFAQSSGGQDIIDTLTNFRDLLRDNIVPIIIGLALIACAIMLAFGGREALGKIALVIIAGIVAVCCVSIVELIWGGFN